MSIEARYYFIFILPINHQTEWQVIKVYDLGLINVEGM
jgi:hypothetical protein